jgi:hypothetical protein
VGELELEYEVMDVSADEGLTIALPGPASNAAATRSVNVFGGGATS